jgi:hypothetical protein
MSKTLRPSLGWQQWMETIALRSSPLGKVRKLSSLGPTKNQSEHPNMISEQRRDMQEDEITTPESNLNIPDSTPPLVIRTIPF